MYRKSWVLFLIILTVTACSHLPGAKPGTGQPAEIQPGRTYQAVASWYGPGFDGRPTASGELFDQDALTAAHRTYPFGTRLRLTNPQNNLSCEVVVNDRGPFFDGVDIDISRGASRVIRRLDTGPVIIEELGRDMKYVKKVRTGNIGGSGYFRVQLGSFTDLVKAEHFKRGLEPCYKDVKISRAVVRGTVYYRVHVWQGASRDEAYVFAKKLADEGYNTWVTRE